MIKVAAPAMALQGHRLGHPDARRAGVSDDFPLAALPTPCARHLRLADGPDEVHREAIGKLELARYRLRDAAAAKPAKVQRGLIVERSE